MKLSELIYKEAPIPEQVAIDLFEFVFDACKKNGCDGEGECYCGGDKDAYLHTREFCRAHGLDEDEVVEWLEREFGATDDCALHLNAASWYRPSGYDPEVDDYGNVIGEELSPQEKQILFDNYRNSREEQHHARHPRRHDPTGEGWLFDL